MKARRRGSASLTLRMLQQQTSYVSWSKSYQLSAERAYQHRKSLDSDGTTSTMTTRKRFNAFLVLTDVSFGRAIEHQMGVLRMEPSRGERAGMHRLEGGTAN